MAETNTLTKQVEEINAELRAFGREAVQEIKMMGASDVYGMRQPNDLKGDLGSNFR